MYVRGPGVPQKQAQPGTCQLWLYRPGDRRGHRAGAAVPK